MPGFVLFGVDLPLWAIVIIFIIVALIAWQIVKFGLKILFIIIVFFVILGLLDYFNVFNWIQQIFSSIVY